MSDLRARYSVRGVEVAWDAGAAEKVLLRWWTDGDVAHEEVVEGDAKIVEGLTPGKCYRVEAATLTEGGAGVPSRTSVFTADVGVKRGRIRSDHDPGHGYSVSFRAGGFDEADPDWVPFFWGMRVPPGGGILRLGEGQRLFDETTRLPTRGYVPAYHRFDEGDVLAIRLADGRYVKVLIRPEVRDVRDELVLDYVFLAMGGREEPEGPTRLTGEPQADGLHLSWIGCEGAATYKVVEWGAEQRVVTTVRETSAVIPDTVRNRFYDLAVIASTASGAEMGACHARIGTWYPWWSIGEVELDWHTTNGYDFSAGTSRQGAGDFWITRSAGGMSSLELTAKSGICEEGIPEVEGKTEIELLEALDGLAWVDKIQADGRSPANGRFAVKTAAGRYAIVRLGDRTSNGRRFEYVYLLPLTDVEEMGRQLTERGGAVDPETLAALRSLLPRLDSDDPAVRDEASLAVEALPREAVLAIAALLREGGLSAEARARLSEAAATLYRKPAR